MSDVDQTSVSLEEALDAPSCRICLESGGNMIQPCDCSGSAGNVHEECLLKWLKISKRKNCEICLFEFELKKEKKTLLIFSEDPALNTYVPLFGVFVLIPVSPICYYVGSHALDAYFAMNLFFIILSVAVMRQVIIMPTLTFWKFCLTVGDTAVSMETQFYDYIIFDWFIVLFFALSTCLCYRSNRRINTRAPPLNDVT